MRLQHVLIIPFLALAWASTAQAVLPAQPVTSRYDKPHLAGQDRPGAFALRAVTPLSDGASCVVGNMPLPSTQAGGNATPPFATILLVGKDGKLLWNQTLSTPGDVKGSLATHCTVAPNGSLYVLLQIELRSPYSSPLSRLTIARIDARSGDVQGGQYIGVPAGQDAGTGSLWTSPSPDALRWEGDHLALTFFYALAPVARTGPMLIDFSSQQQMTVRLDAAGYAIPQD